MEDIYITEEELEYFTSVPNVFCEEAISYNSQISFEEAVKACNGITLEQFSRNLDEAIRRLIIISGAVNNLINEGLTTQTRAFEKKNLMI